MKCSNKFGGYVPSNYLYVVKIVLNNYKYNLESIYSHRGKRSAKATYSLIENHLMSHGQKIKESIEENCLDLNLKKLLLEKVIIINSPIISRLISCYGFPNERIERSVETPLPLSPMKKQPASGESDVTAIDSSGNENRELIELYKEIQDKINSLNLSYKKQYSKFLNSAYKEI